MKPLSALLVLFGIALAAPPANTADKNGDYAVLGPGASSCGKWTQDTQAQSWSMLANQAWVLGYITAFNAHASSSNNVAVGADTTGMFARIDTYCANKPLDSISDAAGALVTELQGR